jgi:hypothetical protein
LDGSTHPTRIREAVGIFHSADGLNAAISDLTGAGVDRAEMSVLGQDGMLDGTVAKYYRDPRQAAEDPAAPRDAVYSDTDVRQGRTLATSMASVVAAFAASGAVVLTGGAAIAAIAAAVGAGGGVGVIGAAFGKLAGNEQAKYLETQIARGGILLWVKITDPALESRICRILSAHAAVDVHVHDMPAQAPRSDRI